jgi:CheY-like chemotaxis protein
MMATTPSPSAKAAPRILVVDDEEVVRKVLRSLLERAGYNVICAANGADALEQLRRIPRPDAILADLFMPQMNGWCFANELKASVELDRVPLFVLTGAGPHWGIPVPEDRFLRKPLESDRLLRLLSEVVGKP